MDNDSLLYFATFSKAIPSFNSSRANSNFPSLLPSSLPSFLPSSLPSSLPFSHPSCLPFIRPSSYIPSPKLHMTAKSPSPSCVKSIPKSLCRVVIFSLAFFDKSFIVGRSSFIELEADDSAAGRSPPVASGDLQLVKKSPNRGYRRGRPKHANTSGTGRLPGRMATAGGPLRAEGIPKRRC